MADVWSQLAVFATRLDRYDLAVDAYKHYIALKPQETTAYVGAAAGMLKLRKLDEAREHASLAAEVAAEGDHRSKASAHEMLAKIALAKHDTDEARAEAALARAEDPTLPLPIYIDARLLYDQGKYADALPGFLRGQRRAEKVGDAANQRAAFLHRGTRWRAWNGYQKRKRRSSKSCKYLPQNIRARGGLAMLYQASDKPEAATRVLDDMLRITPTPDSYALAARLYTMFGNRKQAEAVKLEARRAFAGTREASVRR